jgi:hypothetical protein
MQYMALIYARADLDLTPGEWEALHAEFGAFTQEVRAAGVMVGGAPLEPPETATSCPRA